MIYGERIRQVREFTGLTLGRFAKRVGVPRGYLAALEKDEQIPQIEGALLKLLSNATGFPVGFFGMEPFPFPSINAVFFCSNEGDLL